MVFDDTDLRYLYNQVAYLALLVLHFMTQDVPPVKRFTISSELCLLFGPSANFPVRLLRSSFCVFMDLGRVSVHKDTHGELVLHRAILTYLTLGQ